MLEQGTEYHDDKLHSQSAQKEPLTSVCLESLEGHGLLVIVVFVPPFIIIVGSAGGAVRVL